MTEEEPVSDDKPPIKFKPDVLCRLDLDPNNERSHMWWARLQRRYIDVFPPKVKIGRINHRRCDLWEQFKQYLIETTVEPDPVAARNLERGRRMGREAKKRAREKK